MLRHKPVTPSAILEKERESVISGHVMDFGLDSTSWYPLVIVFGNYKIAESVDYEHELNEQFSSDI